VPLACLPIVLMLSVLPVTADAEGPEIVTTEGVTRIRLLPPGPGNPRNSEGDFIRLKDGRILFIYTHFYGGGGDHSKAFLASRVSSDDGRTWSSEDMIVVPNEGRMNIMSVSLLRLQDGRIALLYLRKDDLDDCRPRLRFSSDEGATWSEPTLCIPEKGYYVVNNGRLVQLSSGRLVIPAALHCVPGTPWTGRGVAMCYLSDDLGMTWYRSDSELQAPPKSGTGLQEPAVVELKDGRLMMLSRTDQGSQFRSYSSDGGITWSPAEPSNIISPVSPCSIERMPSTGDLVLVWNDHSDVADAYRGKRTPLHVAISRDEGQTWEQRKTIEDDPAGWYCYTAIDFAPDAVLLGYCAGNPKVGHLNLTAITRVDIDWLYGPGE